MTNRAYNTAHLYDLDGIAAAQTPFNNKFRQEAKFAGAKWNAAARAWTLPLEQADTLRELLAANFRSFNDEFDAAEAEEVSQEEETPAAEAPAKRELTNADRELYNEAVQAVEELKSYRTLPTRLSEEGQERLKLAERLRTVAAELADDEPAQKFRRAALEVPGNEHHDMAWSPNDVRSLEPLEAAPEAPSPTVPAQANGVTRLRSLPQSAPAHATIDESALKLADDEKVVSRSQRGGHELLVLSQDESFDGFHFTTRRVVRAGPGYAVSHSSDPDEPAPELVFADDSGWTVEHTAEGYRVRCYGKAGSSPLADPYPTTATLREATEWLRKNGHVSSHAALVAA